mgnify:FL=1
MTTPLENVTIKSDRLKTATQFCSIALIAAEGYRSSSYHIVGQRTPDDVIPITITTCADYVTASIISDYLMTGGHWTITPKTVYRSDS